MAKRLPDLGSYTTEETIELALHVLAELSSDQKMELVLQAFPDRSDREELAAQLTEGNEP